MLISILELQPVSLRLRHSSRLQKQMAVSGITPKHTTAARAAAAVDADDPFSGIAPNHIVTTTSRPSTAAAAESLSTSGFVDLDDPFPVTTTSVHGDLMSSIRIAQQHPALVQQLQSDQLQLQTRIRELEQQQIESDVADVAVNQQSGARPALAATVASLTEALGKAKSAHQAAEAALSSSTKEVAGLQTALERAVAVADLQQQLDATTASLEDELAQGVVLQNQTQELQQRQRMRSLAELSPPELLLVIRECSTGKPSRSLSRPLTQPASQPAGQLVSQSVGQSATLTHSQR
jgi:hypothetical protein